MIRNTHGPVLAPTIWLEGEFSESMPADLATAELSVVWEPLVEALFAATNKYPLWDQWARSGFCSLTPTQVHIVTATLSSTSLHTAARAAGTEPGNLVAGINTILRVLPQQRRQYSCWLVSWPIVSANHWVACIKNDPEATPP